VVELVSYKTLLLISAESLSNNAPATVKIEPYYSLDVSDFMNLNSLDSWDPTVTDIISG